VFVVLLLKNPLETESNPGFLGLATIGAEGATNGHRHR